MRRNRAHWMMLIVAVAAPALLLGGCKTYDIHSTVAADGSGHREIKLSMDSFAASETDMEKAEFLKYFILDPSKNWSTEIDTSEAAGTGGEPGGAMLQSGRQIIFRSSGEIADASGWAAVSGDVHIRGSVEKGPYGDVEFINSVELVTGEADSAGIMTYREKFAWKGVSETIVGFYSDLFASNISDSMGALDEQGMSALRDLIKDRLGESLKRIMTAEDEDTELRRLAKSLQGPAAGIVAGHGGESDSTGLARVIWKTLGDSEEELDDFMQEKIPGLSLAFATDLELSITMPGPVIDTNGKISGDGHTATFHMGLLDIFDKDFVAYARCRI